MELTDYDPYRAIGGISEFGSKAVSGRKDPQPDWRPVLEAFHTHDDMVLRYEIPGVLPGDVHVRIDGRVLYVKGLRRTIEEVSPELSMRAERSYGTFDRSIALPEGTDPAGVRSTYLHGVLEIRVAHVRRAESTDIEPLVGQAEGTFIEVIESQSRSLG
jgi:HSP20 family protein